jgi:hypothetical protein
MSKSKVSSVSKSSVLAFKKAGKQKGRIWPVVPVVIKKGRVFTKSPIKFTAELHNLFARFNVKSMPKLVTYISKREYHRHRTNKRIPAQDQTPAQAHSMAA